jgi:hypothetical protein
MLNYNEPETTYEDGIADVNSSIDMFFQRNNLSSGSLDFFPEVGDVVDWNDHFWEINSVTEPQLIAGHQGFRHNVNATAHRSRLSNLQIEERPR